MTHLFSRTERLLGKAAMQRLADSRIAVFGIGGVGGHTAEALVRSGIGAIDLIDNDKVCLTNLNRQIFATQATIGQYKTDAAKERLLQINPNCHIQTYQTFFAPETASQFDFSQYDYVVDAIDTVTGKIELVVQAKHFHTPIISSMGAGNKLDPTAFEVADIYETSVCPLARVMRRELKKRDIPGLKVVYSKEKPLIPIDETDEDVFSECKNQDDPNNHSHRRQIPGSTAFVPSVVGLIIAGVVICDLGQNTSAPSPNIS